MISPGSKKLRHGALLTIDDTNLMEKELRQLGLQHGLQDQQSFLHFAINSDFLNWNRLLLLRSKFCTKIFSENFFFFSEKMKMKNLGFSEGMISESYKTYRWNPQA